MRKFEEIKEEVLGRTALGAALGLMQEPHKEFSILILALELATSSDEDVWLEAAEKKFNKMIGG